MINGPITIREATVSDVPFLKAMIWEALLASPTFLEEHGIENVRQREDEVWKNWHLDPEPAFIAVDVAGKEVGAIRLRAGDQNTPVSDWFFGVAVDAEMRGQGIGRLLIERIIEWAKAHGAQSVSLLVDPTNTPAVTLYRRMGFEQIGMYGSVIKMRIMI